MVIVIVMVFVFNRPMRTQGKLAMAMPTENMKRKIRMTWRRMITNMLKKMRT